MKKIKKFFYFFVSTVMSFHLSQETLNLISESTWISTDELTTRPLWANVEHKKEYIINNAKNLDIPTRNIYLDLWRVLNLQKVEKSLKRLSKDLAKSLK